MIAAAPLVSHPRTPITTTTQQVPVLAPHSIPAALLPRAAQVVMQLVDAMVKRTEGQLNESAVLLQVGLLGDKGKLAGLLAALLPPSALPHTCALYE